MFAEAWVQRELKLINSDYFAVFWPEIKRWVILKWISPFHRHDWRSQSTLIRKISLHDFKGKDIGYRPFDRRALYELKRGLYNAARAKYLMREIDEFNRQVEEAQAKEEDYQHRAAAKAIWHHYQEPTVHLPGEKSGA